MSIDVQLYDPSNAMRASISSGGILQTISQSHPNVDETKIALPYKQNFTSTGKVGGSNDMRVDGSTVNAEFYIAANSENDIYVKTISVLISDNGAKLNLFAALTALTNGVEFLHIAEDTGETIIHEAIKTNLDFIRLGLGQPSIGDGISAFRADLSGGGDDSYLPAIDLEKTFGMQWGIRLRKGTNDRLSFRVRDNLSVGIGQFDTIAFGIKI